MHFERRRHRFLRTVHQELDAARLSFRAPDQILDYLDPTIASARRVLVEDHGDLYEAFVKGRFHGKVCVRYAGSPFVDDDCVPEARVSRDTRGP